MLQFKVKGQVVEFNPEMLSEDTKARLFLKGAARTFFERETGKDSTTDDSIRDA